MIGQPIKRLGITATRRGMTQSQRTRLRELMRDGVEEFHHGDCIGGDAEAHEIVRHDFPDVLIVLHPCTLRRYRAFCKGAGIIYQPRPPLERNRVIVDITDHLLVCPYEKDERVRSGTWYTWRYAEEKESPLTLVPGLR